MIVEQDRLQRRRILEEVRPLRSRRTIYYVLEARDRLTRKEYSRILNARLTASARFLYLKSFIKRFG